MVLWSGERNPTKVSGYSPETTLFAPTSVTLRSEVTCSSGSKDGNAAGGMYRRLSKEDQEAWVPSLCGLKPLGIIGFCYIYI